MAKINRLPLPERAGWYEVDVAFRNKNKPFGGTDWIPYGVPGEPPKSFGKRLDALHEAKRLALTYHKTTRVRSGGKIHGYVEYLANGLLLVRNAGEGEVL
jgi:hypothetical protein